MLRSNHRVSAILLGVGLLPHDRFDRCSELRGFSLQVHDAIDDGTDCATDHSTRDRPLAAPASAPPTAPAAPVRIIFPLGETRPPYLLDALILQLQACKWASTL